MKTKQIRRSKIVSQVVAQIWDNLLLSNKNIMIIGKTLIKMVEEDDKKDEK